MTVDPNRCPDCGAQLAGAPYCASCGLPLRGPLAVQLWQVTNDLATLEAARESLLRALRANAVAPAPPGAQEPQAPPAAPPRDLMPPPATAPAAPAAPPPHAAAYDWRPGPQRAPRPRKEWTPQRVQNLLLATGALLLVVAAIAFTAFTWGRLPIPARGAIMLAVTGVTGWTARWTHRRGLDASAEAIGLLTVVFCAVDAYAARAADLGGLADTDAATYWSVASGVLAALAAAYGRLLPVRSVRYAALAAAQAPLAITAFRLPGLTFAERGAFLAAQAAALAVAAYRLGGLALPARVSAALNWSAAVVLGLATAYGTEAPGDVKVAALVLAATGAVALLAPGDRTVPAGVTTLLAVAAALAPARLELTFTQLPAAISAIGLLAVVGAASVPYAWRRGPLAVGSGAVAVALAAVAPWVGQAAVLPFTWLERPWSLRGDAPAREALSLRDPDWGGSVVTLAVVGVAILALVVAADVFGRRAQTRWWVVGLASVGVLLVPLGFAATYRVALAWLVVAGAAGLAASAALRRVVVAAPATIVLGVAVAWSLASEGATLAVLLATAVAYAAYAVVYATPREPAAGIAAAGAAGFALALALSREAPLDRAGFVLAAAAFALLAAAALLGGRVRSIELVAAGAYAVGLSLTADEPGWLSWTLGGGAVAAGLTSLRPGRRPLSAAAAALLAACSLTTGLAYGLPVPRAGLVLAATSCALVAAGTLLRLPDVRVVGVAAYALGAVLAGGDVGVLAYALGVGAVTAAAIAAREREAAPVAVALAIGCAGTTAYALGAPLDRAGFVVALAAAAAVGLGAWLRGEPGDLVEAVAGVAYVVALGLALDDLGWLSWVLAAGGLTAMANALRPERRWQRWLGTALLTAWSWDRLWIEDVRVPEAYVAPVAALTLGIGHLRRRREPETPSWEAYGAGLLTAFAPTTVLVLSDPGVTRPVALAVAGVVVLLAGVAQRLQAPLAIGAGVLVIDAVVQLAPVAAALPKWATIGAVGLLVIAVGVTYEDRRRDVARLRDTFDSLA